MDVEDDPRTPLLGHTNQAPSSCLHRTASKFCGVESWKRRLPITIWLPKYNPDTLLRDAIAGITVGLTSIPQGIAYAIVAGLPPQVGLYSSIFPGLVYMVFGSCKDVTVGPTAILAALLAKYVAKSADFAYLASFLSGLIIVLLGVLQLGFLLDFISKPVISGFTTAAALQIGASQLKTLFRVTGSSGGTFITSLINFFKNVTTVQLWDSILGIASIIMLVLLKYSNFQPTPGAPSYKLHLSRVWQYVVRARNALVVFGGALFAYILHVRGLTPFALTGKIQGGLPHFSLPPFSTVVGNQTVDFAGMLEGFGPEGLVMPLVTILESIAIAKAFAGPTPVDATQEMVAVGLCNVVCAFFTGMPAAGSFTRTALNRASGVVTQAGGIFKATLVLLSVTLLSETFYFIPRATLAAVIMVAMSGIVEFKIIGKLWRNTKSEFLVYVVTVICGTCAGLEYGILLGAAGDAARALAAAARPDVTSARIKVGNQDCITISLPPTLSYASAEYVSRAMRRVAPPARVIVLDARALAAVDVGVAESIISVVLDLEKQQYRFLLWNFSEGLQNLFEDLHPGFRSRFVGGPSIDQHVLGLHIDRREAVMQSF